MGLHVSSTTTPVPVGQSQPLRRLERRPGTAVAGMPADTFIRQTPVARPLPGRPPLTPLRMDRHPRVAAAQPPTLAATFAAMPSVGGGPADVRLLSRNLDAWNARWDMIAGARAAIDVSYFSFEKDVFGHAMLGALLRKQMQGVPVRLMTDAMADTFGQRGFKMPLRGQDYLQELVNHGGEAYLYNPIANRPGLALRGDYAALSSNHDKVLVVDGQRGITGGRNIGIDYLTEGVDRPGAWRDMDIAIEGAGAARGLTAALDAELGSRHIARPVERDSFGNWSRKDIHLLGAAEMMDLWLGDPVMSEAAKRSLRHDPAARATLAHALVDRALARLRADASLPAEVRRAPDREDIAHLRELAGELVQQLEARGSRRQYQTQSLPERAATVKIIDQTSAAATDRTNGMAPALRQLVQSARERIVIQNPYVVLTEDMLQTLEAASARGVKIDIITNSPLSTDSAVTQAFFLEDWAAILARCENARIFVATGDRKFHTKSAVADGEVSFVSTYNLDLLSGHVNSEVGAVVQSRDVAADLLAEFDGDLADPSNGFLEYRIRRDANGRAILRDGRPIPEFGPEDHLPQQVLDDYQGKRRLWGHTLRNNLPYLSPLRHPERLDGR